MARKKTQPNLDVEAFKEELLELKQEVEKLEHEVHDLKDDNDHLMHKLHSLSNGKEGIRKSTKITSKIDVPANDPFNTELGDRRSLNRTHNFMTFINYHWHSVIKSKLFWILLIIVPIIFTTLFHVLYTLKAGNETGIFGDMYSAANKLSIILINWLIAIPILILTCVVLPGFITSSREDNLLKRLSMNSINRSQIFWFYIISSVLVFMMYLILMFILYLGGLMVLSNTAAGKQVWEAPHDMFFKGGVDVPRLFILAFIFFIGLSALGFYRAMKFKSTKALVAWGTGVFIFSQMTKISLGILDLKAFAIDIDISAFTDFMISLLIFVVKWMFIFTIPTWVFISISTVGRGPSKWSADGLIHISEFDDAWMDADKVFFVLQLITVIFCVAIFTYVWINKDRIINFETGR